MQMWGGTLSFAMSFRKQRCLLLFYEDGAKQMNECGALVEWHWLGKTRITRRWETVPIPLCLHKNSTLIARRSLQDHRGERLNEQPPETWQWRLRKPKNIRSEAVKNAFYCGMWRRLVWCKSMNHANSRVEERGRVWFLGGAVQHTRRQIADKEIFLEWADELKMRLLDAGSVKNTLCWSSVVLFLEAPTVRSNSFCYCILRVSRNAVRGRP